MINNMSDDANLLDGSSYDYKLTKDMLGAHDSFNSTISSPHKENNQSSSANVSPMKSPRIPHFLNSPSPTVSFALKEKRYDNNFNSTINHSNNSNINYSASSRDLSMTDLGSTILEYKKEIEHHENKKREELLNSQVALLEVYRNKIASNNVTIEEIKQEYEQKLYQQKIELNQLHEEELQKLRKEESDRQFTDQVRIGAIKDKLKAKYEVKLQAFQQDVEDTRTALYNKKLQIQGAVDHANREITTLRLQQESTQRIHQNELAQKDEQIAELQAIVTKHKSSQMKDEEIIRSGMEIAALVVHMHHKSRPLSTEDLDMQDLYKYLQTTDSAPPPAGSGSKTSDQLSSQSIVPTAYLQKALQSSKKLIQSRKNK